MTADEIFRIATTFGAECFGTGGGAVEPGKEADLMLVDITGPEMTPLWNLTSSLVYAASGQCVKTLLSGGRILMENRVIPGYEDVRKQAQACFDRLHSLDGRKEEL
jgi:5-methylthioadenosine/S-adenosylhomocysteine deaminase